MAELKLKKENQSLKRQVAEQRERILYLEGELKRQGQYAGAKQLEKKQPEAGEYVQWDSPEKECSPPQQARSRGRSRSPLKPLQLGNSWSQGALQKAGLPAYKCAVTFRRKEDRDKLPAFPCPDCRAWYENDDGIKRDKITCRHRELYPRSKTPPGVWDISFPDSPN